jgi:hypothetical protein
MKQEPIQGRNEKEDQMVKIKTAVAVLLVLCLVGCGESTVIQNLQMSLDAIATAFPIIAALTGVPANVTVDVEAYLDATNTALGQASTILAGPGTDAQKTAQIVAAFAAVAKPVVPVQYASLVTLIGVVAADVAQFLASLPPSSATGTTSLSTANRAKLATSQVSVTDNRAAIKRLRAR